MQLQGAPMPQHMPPGQKGSLTLLTQYIFFEGANDNTGMAASISQYLWWHVP